MRGRAWLVGLAFAASACGGTSDAGTDGTDASTNDMDTAIVADTLHDASDSVPTDTRADASATDASLDTSTADTRREDSADATVDTAPLDSASEAEAEVGCATGEHLCGGVCVSDTAVETCGTLCSPCPVPTHGSATCSGSPLVCGVSCDVGYHVCSDACASDSDVATCGASCTPCPTPANTSATCDGTTCGWVCLPGFADADGSPANGCETPLCAPTPSGLVDLWHGDGDATDATGTNPGTSVGAVTYATGTVDRAFVFDGSDDVHAGTTGLPTGAADRSAECWMRLDAPVSAGREAFLVGYGTFGSAGATWQVGVDATQRLFFSQWGAALYASTTVSTGTWHHVAVTTASGTTTLYLDGASVGSGALVFDTPAATTLFLGRIEGSLGDTRALVGALDEVSMYARALTPAEISAIFSAGAHGKCPVCAAGTHYCGTCVADTSVSSCGASCTDCVPPAHATSTCDGTSCGFTCDAGWVRVGDHCDPRCTGPSDCPVGEACDTSTGLCGPTCASGVSCTPTNVCHVGATDCSTGTSVCNDTGAHVADGTSCGTGGVVCTGGVCGCPSGDMLCGGTCIATDTDPANCGSCGFACSAGQACVGGVCVCNYKSCPTGCCDGSNRCQVGSPSFCGSGGNACVICPFAQTCTGGVCSGCAASCTTGCCAGSSCTTPSIDHCGGVGELCITCDPTLADTCTGGGCKCGSGPKCTAPKTCVGGACI